MARRGYDVRVVCTHPGCLECTRYHFDVQADMRRHFEREPRDKWLCIRHQNSDQVLSDANRTRVQEMVNFETDHGKFWGVDKPSSGFVSGPGFKAFAADFPAGTRIRVITELILPESHR